MKKIKKILVTSALPYANGDIHIGHLVEYLQTDFWVRFQKMQGHQCVYACADDTHGTPIMIRAKQENISPEELIAESQKRHLADFKDFEIEFDNYSSTHSESNREISEYIYKKMLDQNHLSKKEIEQAYCNACNMFLPDRFVKGSCPKCKAENQYGDSCDNCGAVYDPTDMIDAKCSNCGDKPVTKKSEHIFFQLNHFKDFLKLWVPAHTSNEVSNKLKEWLQDDLRDWDISRDAPYFGFQIPGYQDKYFYVWVDAPVGYIASSKEWCEKNSLDYKDIWEKEDWKIYHFIGKDIMYFHTLFWPAMLKNAGFKCPDGIFIHGYLTVNGEKMSKSKGTFINARTYLNHIDPMYLRYYYACKLNSSFEDIDLNFDDFVSRVNSDLIGKITNLVSRGAQMAHKHFAGKISTPEGEGLKLVQDAQYTGKIISNYYENREFNKALIEIRKIAEKANKYFDDQAPWKLIKTDPDSTQSVISAILNTFRCIAIYLKPILPNYVANVEKLFNEAAYTWNSKGIILKDTQLNSFQHLAKRLEAKQIENIQNDSSSTKKPEPNPDSNYEALEKEIVVDDLFKADLRVGKIIEASEVKGASKLLQLKVDLGFETRNIFAGLKQAYTPEQLTNKLVIVVANLKPRKMKFGLSEGMVLASGPGGKDVYLITPDEGATPGQRVQ